IAPGPYQPIIPINTVLEWDDEHPKSMSRKQILSLAEKLALKWLANTDCNKLFNVSGKGPDPSQVLRSLISSGTYSSSKGEIRLYAGNAGANAVDGVTYPNVSLTSLALGADIFINTGTFSLDDGSFSATEGAMTIIHELGH